MSQNELPRTLGLRHLALTVRDQAFEATVTFYREGMGMAVDWAPDADNIYLSSGHDNLAIHRGPAQTPGPLDHLGFLTPDAEAVQDWHARIEAGAEAWGVEILAAPRLHRDGATSFYFLDPAGHKVQIVHVPSVKG